MIQPIEGCQKMGYGPILIGAIPQKKKKKKDMFLLGHKI